MDIVDLVEIAQASSGASRVEVAALEPADVSMEAVSSLAQLVAELVDNAAAFSEPGAPIRVTGVFQQDDYLLSISDSGVGIPDHLIAELNRTLQDPRSGSGPEPRLGIALIARLASRHGMSVQLVPGAPGTTARVTVPGPLVGRPASGNGTSTRSGDHRLPGRRRVGVGRSKPVASEPSIPTSRVGTVDLTELEGDMSQSSAVGAMSESRREAEEFLARVFAPLVKRPGMTERPAPRGPGAGSGNGPGRRPESRTGAPVPSTRNGTVTPLRVRVPGENFSHVDDERSTLAGEGAIDIRSALSKYEQGRRRAVNGGDQEVT